MNTSVRSHIIIRIAGDTQNYVAEVTQENPLHLKVAESGPYSKLKPGDYIIDEKLTEQAQGLDHEQQKLLITMLSKRTPLASGLVSVGITDGNIRQLEPRPH